jgi:hypothetical protein
MRVAIVASFMFVAHAGAAEPGGSRPARNVILFVPDGLRADAVSPETTPTLAALAARGVHFANAGEPAACRLGGSCHPASRAYLLALPFRAAGGRPFGAH